MSIEWIELIEFFQDQTIEPNYYDVTNGCEIYFKRDSGVWVYRNMNETQYMLYPPSTFDYDNASRKLKEVIDILAFHIDNDKIYDEDLFNHAWLERYKIRFSEESLDNTRIHMLEWERELKKVLTETLTPNLRLVK